VYTFDKMIEEQKINNVIMPVVLGDLVPFRPFNPWVLKVCYSQHTE